jgi:hypothetical protein
MQKGKNRFSFFGKIWTLTRIIVPQKNVHLIFHAFQQQPNLLHNILKMFTILLRRNHFKLENIQGKRIDHWYNLFPENIHLVYCPFVLLLNHPIAYEHTCRK